MFAVTEKVSILRPTTEVFDFLTDGRNRPKWDPTVISEELTSPPPIGVGSTIHTRMRAMSREVDFDWRVTDFDAPTRMAIISTAGILSTTLILELVTVGDDTEVTATIEGAPTGLMRIVEPLIADSVRSTLAVGLARAKALLEAPATV